MVRLLLKSPPLVLADEPTGALDDTNAARIVEPRRELARAGSCVVVATHSAAVTSACDNVIDLDDLKDVDDKGKAEEAAPNASGVITEEQHAQKNERDA